MKAPLARLVLPRGFESLVQKGAKVGSSQAAMGCPLQEPHVAENLRLDPECPFLTTRDYRLWALSGLYEPSQLPPLLLGKTAGQFRHVPQHTVHGRGHQQTMNSLTRRRVADDHAGDGLEGFDLATSL